MKDKGLRIDHYLANRYPEYSRSWLQKQIREGFVRVNGNKIRPNYILRAEDNIQTDIRPPEELKAEPEDLPLSILYEDADILIINKPKNMVVHPSAGHPSGTLVNALLYHYPGQLSTLNGPLRPGIVHRLDKDTTGALVICKTNEAHRILAEALAIHAITRKYRAIVLGSLKEDDFTLTGNIGRDPKERKKMALLSPPDGRAAITHVHVLERLAGFTYIECTLETGRTHQIRVHLSSIGHPILGDPVYGPKKQGKNHLEGQTLHAMVLGFHHPRTGIYQEFIAPLPEYFEKLLKKYREH